MLAVRKLARGPGNVEVVDVPEPHAGPGQVVIEVTAAGVCGTDVHIYLDEFVTEPPVTMGHELAGTVVELGPGVRGVSVGDRVTSETYFHTCGRCLHCRRGRPNLCPERRSIGSKADGAFARHLVVPARNLHHLPDGLPLEHAALTEPLACVVHGVVDVAGVRAGDRVAIAGPGPIGLLALQVARASGASTFVLGTGADAPRLSLATTLGATGTVDVQATPDVRAAAAEVWGAPDADLVIECSGAGPAVGPLLELAARGSRYCQMGLFGTTVQFDLDQVCYKELTLTGTNATVPTAWPRALRLLSDGTVDVSALITHRFALSDWPEALATVRDRSGVKVVLRP